MTTALTGPAGVAVDPASKRTPRPRPGVHTGCTTEVHIGGLDVLITTTANPNGTLREVFLTGGKHGSTLHGLLETIGTVLSVALRGGVPLQNFVDRLADVRFTPHGTTDDPDLPTAASITDYLVRRLAADYLRPE